MTASLTQLVDAVGADLEALSLPTHRLWRYAEPLALRLDLGRWLAVFPAHTVHQLLTTTDQYDDETDLAIEWHAPAFQPGESNMSVDTVAKAELDTCEALLSRLRTYANGVPTLGQVYGVLTDSEFGYPRQGLQWRWRATLKVERWP